MCHYEQVLWTCGFWRWDRFKQQCPGEKRIGETCGLRLIYGTITKDSECRLCQDIAKKERRLIKMAADIRRWRREANKPATVEKTMGEYVQVFMERTAMIEQHEKVVLMDPSRPALPATAVYCYGDAAAQVSLPSMRSAPVGYGMATPGPSPRTSPSPGGSPTGSECRSRVETPKDLQVPDSLVAQVLIQQKP